MIGCYGDDVLRIVKWHVKNYEDIKREIINTRLEQKRRSGAPERRSMGFVSDPTQSEAIKNLTPIRSVEVGRYTVHNPESWIECINKVMCGLDKEDRRLVEVAFWKCHSWYTAIVELNMNKDTYYNRMNRVVCIFAIEAASRGLVKL